MASSLDTQRIAREKYRVASGFYKQIEAARWQTFTLLAPAAWMRAKLTPALIIDMTMPPIALDGVDPSGEMGD